MGNKSSPLIPGAIIVGGLGIAYYWWTLKDKTPVGLTITKVVDGDVLMPENYHAVLALGSFRKDKGSLSISSDDEDNPLLVILKDDTPIDALRVKLDDLWADWDDDEEDEERRTNMIERMKNLKSVWVQFGFDTDPLDEQIVEWEGNSAEAETIFGPMLSLQSNFVW